MNTGDVWTLAEFREGNLHEVSFELLAWGRGLADTLGTQLCSVVLTENCPETALTELSHCGADKIYLVDDPALGKFLVEPHAHTLRHLVETYEPSHPFGAKAVAEIPLDGVAPAVGNAILDACGVSLKSIPALPEKIWRELIGLSTESEA